MIVRVPLRAPLTPPETGASMNCRPVCVTSAAIASRRAGRHQDHRRARRERRERAGLEQHGAGLRRIDHHE